MNPQRPAIVRSVVQRKSERVVSSVYRVELQQPDGTWVLAPIYATCAIGAAIAAMSCFPNHKYRVVTEA